MPFPDTIKEEGQLINEGDIIADVTCHINVIKRKKRLNEWEGTFSISQKHRNEAMALPLLDGELELDLENYKGKIIITSQGSGEIRFTGADDLIEKT